ncbi:MAG: aminotransferase class V-fold PLP-dependent enzyme [Frankiaceae bacterium]|nr:aminotransferase class V-fold PLP-dependent enzyme [Frankiaceae bacterium]
MRRTEWLVDPAIAYLNHGGYGALPREVADAAARIRAEVEANPTDVLALQWQGRIDGVRERVAAFLRGDPADLVFVPNATAGTATVIAALRLAAGDEVVTTDHGYPAVASQLGVESARRGVRLVETHVPVDVGSTEAIVGAVLANITDRTRLLVADQIASPTGFVFPVQELVAAARTAGVPVLVDAAHAPGQVDVDLTAIDADFWVGNLHKWVCSPRAAAVMRVAPRWHDLIRPLVASHGYADGFQPAFDWTGTHDPIPILAVPDALDFWDGLGWDQARREQHRLATDGAEHIAEVLGTRVAIRDEHTAAMRLVELPRALSMDDGIALAARLTTEHKVTAHITDHGGASYVRICGQLYNVPEHYERLGSALAAVLP